MTIELGNLATGTEKPMLIDKITLNATSGEIHLHFNARHEGRMNRLDRELEDLPVAGI